MKSRESNRSPNRLGLGGKVQLFMDDGWDSIEMVYTMTKADLKDLGLSEEEATLVLIIP